MSLLSILITLLIDYVGHGHREGRPARWIHCYTTLAVGRLPAGWQGVAGVVAIVAPPVVVLALVQWAVACWLAGVVYVALAVVVLLLALGPVDIADRVDDYRNAYRDGDAERAAWYYREITGEQRPDDPAEEGRRLSRTLLYMAHDHIFATVFWFCVLGPAGALLYRLAAELALVPQQNRSEVSQRSARFICGLLGWIPARLIALGYALTGRFDAAVGAMKGRGSGGEDWLEANRDLLGDVGTAAMRRPGAEERAPEDQAEERRSRDASAAVDIAWQLVIYAGTLGLALIAVLTPGGWVV
jgi:AmpE protein